MTWIQDHLFVVFLIFIIGTWVLSLVRRVWRRATGRPVRLWRSAGWSGPSAMGGPWMAPPADFGPPPSDAGSCGTGGGDFGGGGGGDGGGSCAGPTS